MPDATAVGERRAAKGYRPEMAGASSPLFLWPPQPKAVLRYFFGYPGLLFPIPLFFVGVALLKWLVLLPKPEVTRTFDAGWLALMLAENVVILSCLAGGLHVWFYTKKRQDLEYKFVPRWSATRSSRFLFGNQLWDNIFWSVCSGAVVWTFYEAMTLWIYANGFAHQISFSDHPIYFTFLFLLVFYWQDIHFYFHHRFLHWKPIYRFVHHIHHRNIDTGPWSGLAMDPFEHLVYFSAVALLWVVPAHPVHSLFLLSYLGLGPMLGHLGFGRMKLGSKGYVMLGDYMHALHHRYVSVNFGPGFIPLDRWFGTHHDGSVERPANREA